MRSRLAPAVDVARIIFRNVDNVGNYCRHPVTNAVAEGLESGQRTSDGAHSPKVAAEASRLDQDGSDE